MWMTNRGRLHRFVEQELLPAWGMTCVATWWWLKCGADGQPMTPLSSQHRHPYESLVLLRRSSDQNLHQHSTDWHAKIHTTGEAMGGCEVFEDGVVLFSPRDPAHSRKPQVGKLLWELMKHSYCKASDVECLPYGGLEEQGRVAGPVIQPQPPDMSHPQCAIFEPLPCLELFAREMQAGWTSWGNEVLRFQDAHLFDFAQKPTDTSRTAAAVSDG